MTFAEILSLSMGAILVENIIFVKFLGCCPFLGVSQKTDTATGMGFAVTFVMAVASAVTYLVNTYILVKLDLMYIQTVSFVLIIAALVQFLEMALKKLMPALYQALGIYLPLITTNCAVLGVALLNVEKQLSFFGSVLYGTTAGLGFTLAIFLFASVREKLVFAECPKAFEGIPLALVTAALISIAFMGFQGIQIF